jgi:RHS repeat-associated protein
MEAPSGAVYEYTYLNQNPRSQEMLVWNPVTSREVTHDGTSDLWEYYHTQNYSYTQAPDDGLTEFVHWGERVSGIYRDDGSYTERGWAENPPPYMSYYEIGSRNPYVSAEWTTVGDDGGDPAKSAVTAFEYDRNGNVTGKIEYPWQTWSMTPQVPSPSTALRTTEMDYFYPSPAIPANPDTTDSAYGYWREHHATYWSDDTDPRRLNAIQRQTVSVTGSTPVSILEYEYDDPYTTGNATSEERWDSEKASSPPSLGNLSTSSAQVITRTYNSLGQVTEIAGAAIHTEITYGTIPGGSGPGPYPTLVEYAPGTSEARSFSYEWDYETGLLETKTDEDNDIDTEFAYDDLGRILTVEEAGLRRTGTSYDNDDLLVRVESDLASLGDGKLQTVTHYDQLGRVVLTRVTDGSTLSTSPTATDGIKTSTIYISASGGNRVVTSTPYRSTSDPTLEWTCTQYDLLGRVTTTAMYTGSTAPTTCTSTTNQTAESGIVYDADRTETTDPAGKVREEYRDGMGRLVQVTEDPSGLDYDTTYSYDVLDNLLTVSQGSQDRTFEYSSLGRLLSADNPETGEITYTYHDDGTLASKTDARDITVDYSYDALDRIVEKDYSDATPDVTYTYYTSGANKIGRPESVSTSAATETFNSYDALGRVTAHTQEIVNNSNDYTLSYTYLLNDALATMVYPSGREVDYTLDDAGRIRTVDDGTTTFADLDNALGDYDPRGRIARIELGNGLWETRDYRPAGTATELKLGTSSGGSERLKLAYNYDGTGNNGNLASHVITQAGSTIYTQTFTYDGLNRLDSMTETGGFVRDYEYDQYGNRWLDPTNTTGPAVSDTHEPHYQTNFSTSTNRLSVASSTYDAAGNQTFFTPYTLTYDGENRITEAESASNGNAYYAYDGNGRRVGKAWTPGGGSQTLTYYIYDITGRLAAEYSDEEPEEDETSYVFSDLLGSVRMVTDGSGNVNECYDFLPFGRMLTGSDHSRSSVGCYPSSPTSYTSDLSEKFTGQQRDEIQLDYFQARYLSAAQGRFSTADTLMARSEWLSDPQRWNLYSYVRNNPLKYTDPTGEDLVIYYSFADDLTEEEWLLLMQNLDAILDKIGRKFLAAGVDHVDIRSDTTLTSHQRTEIVARAKANDPPVGVVQLQFASERAYDMQTVADLGTRGATDDPAQTSAVFLGRLWRSPDPGCEYDCMVANVSAHEIGHSIGLEPISYWNLRDFVGGLLGNPRDLMRENQGKPVRDLYFDLSRDKNIKAIELLNMVGDNTPDP